MTYSYSPKAARIRELAGWMRACARETGWPEYGWKMRRTAHDLESEAGQIERGVFYGALFGNRQSIIAIGDAPLRHTAIR